MNRVSNQKEVVNLGLCPNRGGGVRTINPRSPTRILKMGTEKGQLKKIKVGSQFCGGGGGPETWDKFRILTLFLLRKESL